MSRKQLLKVGDISWSQFELCNTNFQISFENMCRQLFNYRFFDGKANFHSNPNNPGVEILPILHESKKLISFQSKYFSSVSYSQIKRSIEVTIKHYKGKLDILYLYCNQTLTTTSKQFKEIKSLLNENDIELEVINNQAILDQVLMYPNIFSYYFNYHRLSEDRFRELLRISLDAQGTRYNFDFNVETEIESKVELFTRGYHAIEKINNKKRDAIKLLERNRPSNPKHKLLVQNICNSIRLLEDVNSGSISNCINWKEQIVQQFNRELKELENSKIELANKRELLNLDSQKTEYNDISSKIYEIETLLRFSDILSISKEEERLIQNKILIIKGNAGSGKSQLFSISAKRIMDEGKHSILLLGSFFGSSDMIIKQILEHLDVNLNLDELLNVLEGIGEATNEQVVIFLDAINESWNKNGWKLALRVLFEKINSLNNVKLAISVRNGYENLVFDSTVSKEINNGKILQLIHYGFAEESIEATRQFLNHYNIPFSPSYLLQHEMTNPLFLTLFCKTYDGNEYDLFTLFDRIISNTDSECKKNLNIDSSLKLLDDFIEEIANIYISENKRRLSKYEVLNLNFWTMHGLTDKKGERLLSILQAFLICYLH